MSYSKQNSLLLILLLNPPSGSVASQYSKKNSHNHGIQWYTKQSHHMPIRDILGVECTNCWEESRIQRTCGLTQGV